ncbi:amphi-Trp domain-containing protein [Haloarchaeobius sp. HRN-SO-5]|uniref:amphi-Trp domain-containing protein n=1 Tax=Haloarchaeobius sp. HRN-SO-5 TaxID=3446118 RepID=UPI003EBB0673
MKELETKREMSREEVAAYFRAFADQLDGTDESDEHARGASDRSTVTDESGVGTPTDRERGSADRQATDETSTRSDYGKVTFHVGNDSHTINPPEIVQFQMEIDSDRSLLGGDEDRGVVFELGWDADAVERDDEFRVE